jgi:flagellar biosynthesis regulator FlaF
VDQQTRTDFENLHSSDKDAQYHAFTNIIEATNNEVDWAYEVWNQLIEDLTNKDNHRRSRAAQFLCGLAKSDPEKRMLHDFRAIWEVTFDKKFVTARHTLQSIWKVGLAGEEQRDMLLTYVKDRFIACTSEKNYTLIRFDLIQGLRYLYDHLHIVEIKQLALELIEKEEDPRYKKKYATVWK